jgi:transposase
VVLKRGVVSDILSLSKQSSQKEELMASETTQTHDTPNKGELYLAIEMSRKEWKLAFTVGMGQDPRLRSVTGRDLDDLLREITLSKKRFGLGEAVVVRSCYEAGRDGFYLARYLAVQGVNNLVVDSASIEVNRRFRRAKTDRMDAGKLLSMLVRYHQGERKVWSVVHVPSVEVEDQRQLHRELMALKKERTHHINRMKGLLASQGVELEIRSDFPTELESATLWDGSPLRARLQARLLREYERYQQVKGQVKELEGQRLECIRRAEGPVMDQVRQLLRLKGIGVNSAWLYVMEFFSWRGFRNRRELGSLAGLTPTPYQSGESARERGISKAGNQPVRSLAIEIAWAWLRFQPDSQLSQWYQARFAQGSSRMRRIGIVALARKLLVALWRYLETGLPPQGAILSDP